MEANANQLPFLVKEVLIHQNQQISLVSHILLEEVLLA